LFIDITSHGSNSYQSSLNPLQPVQHLSDMANGSVYSQLIKSLNASTSSSQQQVSYLSKNAAYSSVPQHELSSHKHKTTASENISLTPSVASAEDNKKGAKQLVLDSTDNKTAGLSDQDDDDSDGLSSSHYGLNKEDKKSNKRAANRLSAQLSRRRRKMFMEELKEENEKLKRKESILNSIPDLVIVFDSAGKISFISKSACTILKFQVEELQESSFWGLLCEESERQLKAAFMDSLAAKEEDTESVPLGQGMWEIRMVDKDKSQKVVALHGVVHFTGENPQCVCTIRPREQYTTMSSSLPLSQNVPTDMRNSHSNIFSTKSSTSSSSSKISSVESVTSRGVVSESTTDGF
jgi:PAS domain S-box-containing protein